MNQKRTRRLLIVLVMLAGGFYAFDHFYYKGIQSLEAFSVSYDRFDRAISEFSLTGTADSERQVDGGLRDLRSKAAFRLSSLIKNDGKLMSEALEVAELSGRELASLKAYQGAIQNKSAGGDELSKELGVLSGKRKAAFARFLELAGKGE
jgi:hypothetical protein